MLLWRLTVEHPGHLLKFWGWSRMRENQCECVCVCVCVCVCASPAQMVLATIGTEDVTRIVTA